MAGVVKIYGFKDGKVMSENRTAYANGEYVLLSDYDKTVDELERAKSYITQLKYDLEEMERKHEDEIAKFKENMMSVIRDDMKPYRDPNDMKMRIAELESELDVKDNLLKIKNGLNDSIDFEADRFIKLPFDPLETANMLINATYKAEIPFLEKQVDRNVYDIDDLEQIAEHLLVYCKHNREDE